MTKQTKLKSNSFQSYIQGPWAFHQAYIILENFGFHGNRSVLNQQNLIFSLILHSNANTPTINDEFAQKLCLTGW